MRKRLLACCLAISMCLGMAVPTMAEENAINAAAETGIVSESEIVGTSADETGTVDAAGETETVGTSAEETSPVSEDERDQNPADETDMTGDVETDAESGVEEDSVSETEDLQEKAAEEELEEAAEEALEEAAEEALEEASEDPSETEAISEEESDNDVKAADPESTVDAAAEIEASKQEDTADQSADAPDETENAEKNESKDEEVIESAELSEDNNGTDSGKASEKEETEQEEESSDEIAVLTDTTSGTCGKHLTWKLIDGTLTISGTGSMYYNCFANIAGFCDIEKVIITDGVTSIGAVAFEDCSSLTSITIPKSVTSIGSYAFWNCSSLTSITIPNSVTSIGNYTFCDCSSLTSITIPNRVTSIGDGVFEDCSSLKSLTIPNRITSIGDCAFEGCSNLTSITIPNTVTNIGNWAFMDCSSLRRVTLSEKLTSIGEGAFADCYSLTSLTIPNRITSIGECTFEGCSNLTSITIPNRVTNIRNWAFKDCSSLRRVTLSEKLTSIGEGAFAFCYSLTSITIPNGVTSIGKGAFDDSCTIKCGKCTAAYKYVKENSNPYKITLKPGNKHTVVTVPYVAPTYTKKGLTAGSKCSVCGKVIKAQKTVAKKVLAKPVISSVANVSTGVKVSWKKVTNASGYYVYRGSTKVKTITSGSKLTFTDTGAKTNGKKYTYKVVAYRGESKVIAKSAASAQKSIYFLSQPTISSVKNSSSKAMKVTWKKNNKATGYQIQYSTSKSFSSAKIVTVLKKNTISKKITGLTAGKKYYVQVRAYKKNGGVAYKSAWSAVKSVRIISKVKSIKLNKTKLNLSTGKTAQLTAKLTPTDTTDKIRWSSSNTKVATVNQSGKVTAKKAGTAKITAKVGSKNCTCTVKVENPKLSKTKLTLMVGKSATLKVSGTKQTVKWSSGNTAIATVTKAGKVTAKKAGTAKITAKVGSKNCTCIVEVENPKLSKTKLTLVVGKSATLKVSGTKQTVTWSSGNTAIATVTKAGKVTAKKAGTAKITAKVGSKKYTCTVTVKAASSIKAAPKSVYAKIWDLFPGIGTGDDNLLVSINITNNLGHDIYVHNNMVIYNGIIYDSGRTQYQKFGLFLSDASVAFDADSTFVKIASGKSAVLVYEPTSAHKNSEVFDIGYPSSIGIRYYNNKDLSNGVTLTTEWPSDDPVFSLTNGSTSTTVYNTKKYTTVLSSSNTKVKVKCIFCGGSGKCTSCNGTGKLYLSRTYDCRGCTSGRCEYCNGKGFVYERA